MCDAALPIQVLGLSPDSPFFSSSRLDSLSLAEKEALLPSLEQRCANRAREYARRCQSVLSRRSRPDLERGAEQRREIEEKRARNAEARARELREDTDRLTRSWASLAAAEEGQARLDRSRREEEAAVLSRGYREAQERREAERGALREVQKRELQAARDYIARSVEAARRGRERKVAAGAEAKRACLEEAQRRREQRAAEKSDEIDPFESSYRALDRSTLGLVGSVQAGSQAVSGVSATMTTDDAKTKTAVDTAIDGVTDTATNAATDITADSKDALDEPLRLSALSPAAAAGPAPHVAHAPEHSGEPVRAVSTGSACSACFASSTRLAGSAASALTLGRSSTRVHVSNYAGPEDDTPALQQKEAQRRTFLQQAHRESLELQARKREEAYAALQAEKEQFYKQYQAMAEAVRNRRAQRVQEQRKYHAELENAEKARKLAEDIRKVDEMIERKKREYAIQREEARRLADARAAQKARQASERSREAEERRERDITRRFAVAFEQLHSM